MKKQINIIELFSGIGGFSLGLKRAGYEIQNHYFSEIDKYAIANYKYNFPNAKSIGSVTDVRGRDYQDIDIITFGSPCQDFSLAGKRKGIEGERSSLILEAIRLIAEIKPSVFIWENVKGTFRSNNGADFWAIIRAFTNIGGYRLEWQLLNTSWVLPQNRERIYLIGHLAGKSEPRVFPFSENDRLFDEKAKSNKRQSQAKDYLTTITDKTGNRADSTFVSVPKKSATLTAGGNSGGLHSDMTTVKVGTWRDFNTPDRKQKRQNGRRIKEDGEPAFTCNCQDQHGIMITSATKKGYELARIGDSVNYTNIHSDTKRGRVGKKKAQTLDTACNQGVLTKTNIRRLTEIETERLQGFPDNHTKYGLFIKKSIQKYIFGNTERYRTEVTKNRLFVFAVNNTLLEKKEISKTQRYKMTGNAVTVDIVEMISRRLLDF